MISLGFKRSFYTSDANDVNLDYRQYRIGAGWSLVTLGTVVTAPATLIVAAAKYSTSDPPTTTFTS